MSARCFKLAVHRLCLTLEQAKRRLGPELRTLAASDPSRFVVETRRRQLRFVFRFPSFPASGERRKRKITSRRRLLLASFPVVARYLSDSLAPRARCFLPLLSRTQASFICVSIVIINFGIALLLGGLVARRPRNHARGLSFAFPPCLLLPKIIHSRRIYSHHIHCIFFIYGLVVSSFIPFRTFNYPSRIPINSAHP